MLLLSLLISLVLFVVMFNYITRKLNFSKKETCFMIGSIGLFQFINLLIGLIPAIIKGTFFATLGGSLIFLLFFGFISYYYMKQADYDLRDLF